MLPHSFVSRHSRMARYGPVRDVSASSLARMIADVKEVLSSYLGGNPATWEVRHKSSGGVHVVRRSVCAPPAVAGPPPEDDELSPAGVSAAGPLTPTTPTDRLTLTAVDDECFELCRQRYVTGASRAVMRDGMPRTVPWDVVQLRWEQLARGPTIESMRDTDDQFRLARQLPSEKLQYMMQCLQSSGRLESAGWPLRSELWIRLGVDGVRMWKSNVVTVSLGACSVIKDLPLHSMYRFGLVAVQRSQETVASLNFLMNNSGLAADVRTLDGSRMEVVDGDGVTRVLRVRVFVCGDHMALSKLTGAKGPGSTHDGMEMCPYCAGWPSVISDIAAVAPPIRLQSRPEALLSVSPLQCPPDVMHGAVNVLHNSIFPCMMRHLREAGWSKAKFYRYMNSVMHLDIDFDRRYGVPKADALSRSIDSATRFLRDRRWVHELAGVLRNTLNDRVPAAVGALTAGNLFVKCFRAMSIQVDIAYTPSPTPTERAAFAQASVDLRLSMAALQCKSTPWVHVWLGHLHQFLEAWGTLYPWLGHGVEGRHRRLKQEVRTSTCGQMKNGQVGFSHCLRRDNVWWSLVAATSKPAFSSVRADRGRLGAYAAYRRHLQEQIALRTGPALLIPSATVADTLFSGGYIPCTHTSINEKLIITVITCHSGLFFIAIVGTREYVVGIR
jgi:hypothetical protein